MRIIWSAAATPDAEADLDVTGVTFPGVPYVVAGHNADVAWGFTNGFADVQDLYMERLRRMEDGRVQYEFRGEWLDAQVLQEEVREGRRAGDAGGRHHAPRADHQCAGPRFRRRAAAGAALDVAGARGHDARALDDEPGETCLEFRGVARLVGPVQNTVYADDGGNIGYSLPGNIPMRARGDGRVPVPGWTEEYE